MSDVAQFPPDDAPGFDWGKPGSRPFGLSERQFRLCQEILTGKTQLACYRIAYLKPDAEDNATNRSTASAACRSAKVKAALSAYRAWEGVQPDEIVDEPELLRILSRAVRTPSTSSERVQAATLLARIQDGRREQQKASEISYEKLQAWVGPIIGAKATELLAVAVGVHPTAKFITDLKGG